MMPLITMHRTVGAGWFFFSETTALQPSAGVVRELLAFLAQSVFAAVLAATVNRDHRRHCFPFPRQSRCGQARGGFQLFIEPFVKSGVSGSGIHDDSMAGQNTVDIDAGQMIRNFGYGE